MTEKIRWLIVGFSLLIALLMECFFVRFTTPLAFVLVLITYGIGWVCVMTVGSAWRARWPLFGLIPLVLMLYALFMRVDPDMWPLEAVALGFTTLLMSGAVPLIRERGSLFTVRSLPFVRYPSIVLKNGFSMIKDMLAIRLPTARIRHILTGVLVSMPLLLIFGALFYSADGVFKEMINHLSGFKHIFELISWSGVRALIRYAVWFVLVGGLWLTIVSDGYKAVPRVDRSGTMPPTTVLIVIGLLSALFVVFNAAQLMGIVFHTGLPRGMMVYEYAREGFAQLVATLGLAFVVVWFLCRSYGQERWPGKIRFVTALFLSQLIPVAISAWYRLNMYQEAFGYTLLRLYAEWAIIASFGVMGVLCAVMIGKIRYERIVQICLVGALFWFSITAAIGPSYLVARRNLARFIEEKNVHRALMLLDVDYLTRLSPDSVRAWTVLEQSTALKSLDLVDSLDKKSLLRDRLQYLHDRLPGYGLPKREDGQGVFWNFHPGEKRLQAVVDQLLVALR